MSTKPSDTIPEPSHTEWTVQALGGLYRGPILDESYHNERYFRLLEDLDEADCLSDRDAVAMLAAAQSFYTNAAIAQSALNSDQYYELMLEFEKLFFRVLRYLEGKTGLKAADFFADSLPMQH